MTHNGLVKMSHIIPDKQLLIMFVVKALVSNSYLIKGLIKLVDAKNNPWNRG